MNESLSLGRLLAQAFTSHTQIDTLPDAVLPRDAGAAYDAQHEIVAALDDTIGGWKVGAKTPDGPRQGAPLPRHGVSLDDTGVYTADARRPFGLELEFAFRFGRRFEPTDRAYPDAEVEAAIAEVGATIEVVASRFAGFPAVDRLLQLADLQNHGALAAGEFVPYRADLQFVTPELSFTFNGQPLFSGTPANPAGDPRRLLSWLVNHATVERGIAITPDQLVTCGSYVGLVNVAGSGVAVGQIGGLPPVTLTIA
ncbi:2-keto-4-pentenoate hydratase [Burkholderia plantarii]|uniref:Hydratase/decarboxylase n=1 Tax=Burkholderia plantarii TaxID=41899 RepID=A0A0B6S0E5_BURPL|nr:2-keto-4-pentenoate hydratase [Burkholderia plantarii]AJK49123.1 hydratase/decarboxylase [Burkholderia plantarii]ALK33372.1 Hydratase/decarboxylase [Burkholderia plantarii]WLE62432.1 2-keto-4-pentenoate hydratase [Burkholderia plantarii]GLZ16533.1 fumarylacetoacetate hydrolase [Burkholderia plantarii]